MSGQEEQLQPTQETPKEEVKPTYTSVDNDAMLTPPPEPEAKPEEQPADDDDDADGDLAEPEQITTTDLPEDPGEFVPGDHSFDVVVYDENGEKPKVHHITNIDEWDKLVEGDPNFGSGAAMLKAQRQITKMENALDREREAYEAKKTKYDEAVAAQEANQKQLDGWSSEIAYLVSSGKLPKIANKYVNADWSDPEISKQDGVKEQLALIKYAQRESKLRVKAGLPPITSMIDAYNAWQLDKGNKATSDQTAERVAAVKAASARVAGATPAPVNATPSNVMVGRVLDLRL
jgi:hypothetical protein